MMFLGYRCRSYLRILHSYSKDDKRDYKYKSVPLLLLVTVVALMVAVLCLLQTHT